MDDWNLPPILVSKNKFETTEYDGPVLPVLLFVAAGVVVYLALMMFLANGSGSAQKESDASSNCDRDIKPDPAIVIEDGSTVMVDHEDIENCYV